MNMSLNERLEFDWHVSFVNTFELKFVINTFPHTKKTLAYSLILMVVGARDRGSHVLFSRQRQLKLNKIVAFKMTLK